MDIHEYQAKKILADLESQFLEEALLTVQKMQKIKLENWEDLNGWLKLKSTLAQEVRLAE